MSVGASLWRSSNSLRLVYANWSRIAEPTTRRLHLSRPRRRRGMGTYRHCCAGGRVRAVPYGCHAAASVAMMTGVGLWNRLDVLVAAEQVGRVILVLQRHQAAIAVAIRRPHPIAALIVAQEVDIHATR